MPYQKRTMLYQARLRKTIEEEAANYGESSAKTSKKELAIARKNLNHYWMCLMRLGFKCINKEGLDGAILARLMEFLIHSAPSVA